MEMRQLLDFLPLVALIAWAAAVDIRTRRIPNWMTGALIASGLLQSTLQYWPLSIGQASGGMGIGIGLTFILFALGAMGAGDVKLFAGVGAWVGPARIIEIFAAAAIAGMFIVIAQALRRRQMASLLRGSAVIVLNAASGDLKCPEEPPSPANHRRRLPYAVPTLVACIFVLASGRKWL